ncbi:MAG: aspartate--tRNA ligase [Candidatus Shikimatogenerans bostrichidophilus]|nr:MAG: aspartate--tRNA ligase [Candidatus Shikimatogenerans bostrichidophilus]
MYRTHNCGELRKSNINDKVILSGWVNSIRSMKNKFFIDLRDFYGITQLLIYKRKIKIKNEYLINISGLVIKRKFPNLKIKTGYIEILVNKYKILNKSIKLPFNIKDKIKKNNINLLTYRYLYIRNIKIKNNLIIKSNLLNIIRHFFIKEKFLEIETPILVKETSEGANNFIVPYRKSKGLFYSLPQSPQTFKQLLMIGGIDKYYQIAKCFRDEDIRKDRQPEFLQLDIEMSFVKIKQIYLLIKKFLKYIFLKIHKIKLINIKKITYKKIINKYKTDKPDLRYKIYKIKIKNKYFKKKFLKYKIFSIILPNYLNIKNILKFNIRLFLKQYVCKKENIIIYNLNLNIFNYKNIFKNNKIIKKIINKYFFSKFDILLILLIPKSNNKKIWQIKKKINEFLFRSKYNKEIYIPIFIYKFPLFKLNKLKNIYECYHHPFTKPWNNKNKITKDMLAQSYDLIINGIEIGSGSIRIDKNIIQKKIFSFIGLSKLNIKKNFNFFLKALNYGTPPHGGIGIGIDRLILSLFNKKNIQDIIAFPKNYLNKDIMINTPTKIDKKKLLKLGLKIIK